MNEKDSNVFQGIMFVKREEGRKEGRRLREARLLPQQTNQ
jgi:hypothetical protein